MIRCIPVDGSAPFEVPGETALIRNKYDGDGRAVYRRAETAAMAGGEWLVGDAHVVCRIESWRERAERLEKELAELRQKIALDAMDKRRESEHG